MPNTILLAERVLLQTLCFDLQIVHPYKACLDKARLIKREFHDTSSQHVRTALQYMSSRFVVGKVFLFPDSNYKDNSPCFYRIFTATHSF